MSLEKRIEQVEDVLRKGIRHGKHGRDGVDGKPGERGLRGVPGQSIQGDKGDPGRDGIDGLDGKSIEGPQGLKGEIGQRGTPGQNGLDGKDGDRGPRGHIGPMPKHEWEDTALKFEIEPGKWGELVELKGDRGPAGQPVMVGGGGGGMVDIADSGVTPGSYTNANITVNVKGQVTAAANGSAGGSGAWGGISGAIDDQLDLKAKLDAKLDDSQAGAFGLLLLDDATQADGRTTLGLGTAATTAATDYATAAQGVLAGTAVQPARTIATTAPLTGGGDLSANRTLAISAATTIAAGSMSAADKVKLDGITAGASGTVTEFTFRDDAGIAGTVTNSTTTPELQLALTDITPTSVVASGTVEGSNLSGTNTGDQTSIVGITGTLAQFNTALAGADFATGGGTATGTNTGDQTLGGLGGQPLDATLTALAGQNLVANAVHVGSGADTATLVTFAANTFGARASTGNYAAKVIMDYGLDFLSAADINDAKAVLDLEQVSNFSYEFLPLSDASINALSLKADLTGLGGVVLMSQMPVSAFMKTMLDDVDAVEATTTLLVPSIRVMMGLIQGAL